MAIQEKKKIKKIERSWNFQTFLFVGSINREQHIVDGGGAGGWTGEMLDVSQ